MIVAAPHGEAATVRSYRIADGAHVTDRQEISFYFEKYRLQVGACGWTREMLSDY